MAETTNTRGIVLLYEPWREVDRTYIAYTEVFGKVRIRAMGIRKPQAKLAGVMEPFAEVEFYLIHAKHHYKLGGAVVLHRFQQLRQQLTQYNAAVYCAEVLHQLTKTDAPDANVYQLFYTTLAWLEHAPYSRMIPFTFTLKLIHALGFDVLHKFTQPDTAKVARWLLTASLADAQKLRLDDAVWQQLDSAVQLWLYEAVPQGVQSQRFLV